MSTAKPNRLDYIELLRVIALGAVIAFHFFYSAIARGRTPNVAESPMMGWAQYGYLGVELFFMISGFVMMSSTKNISAGTFLKKRFLRLFPMYWIALIFIFVVSQFGIWQKPGLIAEDFYYSLTMAPKSFSHEWLDSAHWFLEKQLQFYLIVLLVLAVRAGKYFPNILTWWAMIGLFWSTFGFEKFGIWYLNGFFALIAGGAIIFSIRESGFNKIRIAGLISSYAWALSSRIDLIPWLDKNRGPGHSALVIGTVVTFLYLLMLLTLTRGVSRFHLRGIGMAGAITYPLFLIHNRVGGWAIARFASPENQYFVYLLVILILILFAFLILKTESRIMKKLQSK
jgi:peptidoglycan/LPS O-acetylase OafA/YrhL